MAKNLFSIPIFFIVFRETLEAAIIISVLLGLAEQIVHEDGSKFRETSTLVSEAESKGESDQNENVDDLVHRRRLVRKMRIQVTFSLIYTSFALFSRVFRFLLGERLVCS